MRTLIAKLARCNRGATAIEYGLILACIALAIVASAAALGRSVQALWTNTNEKYDAATS